jgi:hypothetical protein
VSDERSTFSSSITFFGGDSSSSEERAEDSMYSFFLALDGLTTLCSPTDENVIRNALVIIRELFRVHLENGKDPATFLSTISAAGTRKLAVAAKQARSWSRDEGSDDGVRAARSSQSSPF